MKRLFPIIFISIIFFSCEQLNPTSCSCVGYDTLGVERMVICENCEANISSATCKELNIQYRDSLLWKYEEGPACKIPAPPLPVGG